MVKSSSKNGLTDFEKSIIKALLLNGERSQDIHILINIGRSSTINFGRLSSIKKDANIIPAKDHEIALFKIKKERFNHSTGLCTIDDERLTRSREAMILAVEIFNTPRMHFKAGIFSILSNIAWTYLMHEVLIRKGVIIKDNDGRTLSLSNMLKRSDCPLPSAVRKNISAIKAIRDVVEHDLIGSFDKKWTPIFQASCLNFEKYLTILFGDQTSLKSELGLVVNFAKLSLKEISLLQLYDLPQHIASLDAKLAKDLEEEDEASIEYQFKVIYTLQGGSKSTSHFQFIQPESAEGKEISNVLTKYKISDELYPLKPSDVVKEVKALAPDVPFTADKHQRAWKFFKIRPNSKSKDPGNTNTEYCIYHKTHNDYTYSNKWVEFLVEQIQCGETWQQISSYK